MNQSLDAKQGTANEQMNQSPGAKQGTANEQMDQSPGETQGTTNEQMDQFPSEAIDDQHNSAKRASSPTPTKNTCPAKRSRSQSFSSDEACM